MHQRCGNLLQTYSQNPLRSAKDECYSSYSVAFKRRVNKGNQPYKT